MISILKTLIVLCLWNLWQQACGLCLCAQLNAYDCTEFEHGNVSAYVSILTIRKKRIICVTLRELILLTF